MTSPGWILSRRDLGLVAAALLIPLPLCTLTGLSAPLPNAIERGVGGLIAIEMQDEHSGEIARAGAPAGAKATGNSAERSLAVTHGRVSVALRRVRHTSTTSSVDPRSTGSSGTGGDTDTHHEELPDENGGGTGSPDDPGEPGPSGDSGHAGGLTGGAAPNAQIDATGAGPGSLATIERDGLSVALAGDGAAAGATQPVDAEVSVARSDGELPDADVAVPIPGAPLP
jgi:hypothetical protein